ncbi:MAG: iron ABC transporter permease [Pseudomonadota bacterium]
METNAGASIVHGGGHTAYRKHRDGGVIEPLILAVTFSAAILAAAPAIAVLASLLSPFGDTIRHVITSRGADYMFGTAALCLSVGLIAGSVGVAAALLTALCEFPLRRFFSFALALPLAAPAYIAAYAYADLLGPFGALAPLARAADMIGLPDIRSLPGAVFVLSMTLYPYAYLSARAAFASRSASIIETARTLGVSPFKAAIGLLIPATRPAIAGGVALIMMETAAEFGVADYFGIPTLSVGIFRTWHSFGDLGAASQLASALFLFALLLVGFEALGRRGRTADAPRTSSSALRYSMKGAERAGAVLFCSLLILFGFAAPTAALAAKLDFSVWFYAGRGLWPALTNSISIAALGTAITLMAALLLSYIARSAKSPATKTMIRIATLGYAIPGAVIAVGVLAVFSFISEMTGAKIWLLAGPVALLYAYAVRFITAGYNTTSGGLAQIDPGLDAAARTLGASGRDIFTRIHAPLLRRSIVAAAIILAVDIVKELPATLILRDFNFETLATRVYRLASDERLTEAAPDALMLIALSAIPVFALHALAERAPRA